MTNTGASTIFGDLGVAPGLAITGFPPGLVLGGSVHAADATALQAQSDVTAAYDALASEACDFDLTGQDLGGLTLTSGVYCFSSTAQLTGALALDAQGDPDAIFVFKVGSGLTTASDASVTFVNGGNDCHTFWQIGSSATLGTGTAFAGSILALASITLNAGASVSGRALARTGAVTMDDNHVFGGACADVPQCITIQRGTSGTVADVPLFFRNPATSYGGLGALYTGIFGDKQSKSLVRFELSAIPVGAKVVSATMTLTGLFEKGEATVNVHRVLGPWSEPTATWNNFLAGFDGSSAASFQSSLGPISFSVKKVVQHWVSGESKNDGFAIEQGSGLTYFASSEWAKVQSRPKLVVCYDLP